MEKKCHFAFLPFSPTIIRIEVFLVHLLIPEWDIMGVNFFANLWLMGPLACFCFTPRFLHLNNHIWNEEKEFPFDYFQFPGSSEPHFSLPNCLKMRFLAQVGIMLFLEINDETVVLQ
ncbi:MAG: hypothetical protein ACOC30_01235 [Marinilabilia sp.]